MKLSVRKETLHSVPVGGSDAPTCCLESFGTTIEEEERGLGGGSAVNCLHRTTTNC